MSVEVSVNRPASDRNLIPNCLATLRGSVWPGRTQIRDISYIAIRLIRLHSLDLSHGASLIAGICFHGRRVCRELPERRRRPTATRKKHDLAWFHLRHLLAA